MMGHPNATDWWAGEGGSAYHQRQAALAPSNIAFFARALRRAEGVHRIVELGAGAGMNIEALRRLMPDAHLQAVEVNANAAESIAYADSVFCTSIFDFDPAIETSADLVLTKGLLIHIPDADLIAAYDKIMACTARYVLLAEYYAPKREEIPYRGEMERLWRGDYAGDMLRRFRYSLALVDYGFVWRSDPAWPQDDLTWFLLEKR